jgi:hypothetical protein
LDTAPPIRDGQVLTGPLFSEPMRVETVRPNGPDTWLVGLVGLQSEQFRRVTLTKHDLTDLATADAYVRSIRQAMDRQGAPFYLRLANALSALYPRGSEEKRLLDAMLLAVPR